MPPAAGLAAGDEVGPVAELTVFAFPADVATVVVTLLVGEKKAFPAATTAPVGDDVAPFTRVLPTFLRPIAPSATSFSHA